MRKTLIGFLVLFICLYSSVVSAQFQGSGGKIGVGAGIYAGHTDYEEGFGDLQFCGHGRMFVRAPFSPHWGIEGGSALGRIKNDNYKTVLWPSDLRLLFSPINGKSVNPYLYAGVGVLYYNLDEANTAYKMSGYTGFIPVGLGLQFALGEQTALELTGGYNYTFTDDLEMMDVDQNDGFLSLMAGLTFSKEDPNGDPDGDGLINRLEKELGTDSKIADSDGDGLADGAEYNTHKTDPLLKDTDGDGLSDGDEILTHKTSAFKADTDGDALTDPDEINKFKTNPLLADTDGDGLNDAEELQKHKTSPLKADTDDDGLTDSEEINKTGTNPLLADTDGDKISDGADKCPLKPETVNGYEDEDGCPDKKPEVVFEKKAPIVLDGVTFKTGKAQLTDSAKETLGKVVTTLTDHPEIALEIQGHTDSVGRRSFNVKLSQKRANSVKAYLVSQGIGAKRLTAKGYGPDVPVASNKTDAGRQLNRRISFIRVD